MGDHSSHACLWAVIGCGRGGGENDRLWKYEHERESLCNKGGMESKV